jgi:hypothetical protein
MLIVTLSDTLGSASHNVGFPIISKTFDEQSSAQIMGYIIAIWATGKLLGALLCKRLGLVMQSNLLAQDKKRMEKGFFIAILIKKN